MKDVIKNFIKKFIGRSLLFDLKFFWLKFTKNYITSKIKGTEKDYLDLYNSIIEEYKNDQFIQNKFEIYEIKFISELAKITQISIKRSAPNFYHGFIIYDKLKSYILKNQGKKIGIFETGTAKGFSSTLMSFCAFNKKINYELHTIDMIPNNVKIYWNSISDTKNGKINRASLLKDYEMYLEKINYHAGNSRRILKKLNIEKINFAFLDGSHEYEDCKLEFNYIDKRNDKGDIIIFDDYTQERFDGVCKIVDEIILSEKYHHEIYKTNKNRGYAILTKK